MAIKGSTSKSVFIHADFTGDTLAATGSGAFAATNGADTLLADVVARPSSAATRNPSRNSDGNGSDDGDSDGSGNGSDGGDDGSSDGNTSRNWSNGSGGDRERFGLHAKKTGVAAVH